MPFDRPIRVPMARRLISRTYEKGGGGLAAEGGGLATSPLAQGRTATAAYGNRCSAGSRTCGNRATRGRRCSARRSGLESVGRASPRGRTRFGHVRDIVSVTTSSTRRHCCASHASRAVRSRGISAAGTRQNTTRSSRPTISPESKSAKVAPPRHHKHHESKALTTPTDTNTWAYQARIERTETVG